MEKKQGLTPGMVKKKRLPRVRVLGITIIVFGLMILLVISMVNSLKLIDAPGFCSSCHEMFPENVTWKASSHNKVTCIKCHSEPGITHMVTAKVRKAFLLPITLQRPLADEICVKCHAINRRVVTPTGDLIIPHDRHQAKGITCVTCHRGVTHGNIALRQQTIDGDFTRWSMAMGKAQTSTSFTLMSMTKCMECHQQEKASNDCETCHKKIVPPADHQDTSWVSKGLHGQNAATDLKSCDRCHSYANKIELVSVLDKVDRYSRLNKFCNECHAKRPPDHSEAWKSMHGEKASFSGRSGCLVCHSTKLTKGIDKANTYCDKCHKSQHKNFDRQSHPVKLDANAKIMPACVKCHNKKLCISCHYIP